MAYNAFSAGLEYERIVIEKTKNDFLTIVGIGAENIKLDKNLFGTDVELGAFYMTAGLGYSYYFNSKHGPKIMLLYRHADYHNDDSAASINKNFIIIRLTYNIARRLRSE